MDDDIIKRFRWAIGMYNPYPSKYPVHERPRSILRYYHATIADLKKIEKRLYKPGNKSTRKPLTANTIEKYESWLKTSKESAKQYKSVIRMLVDNGFLGHKSPRKKIVSLPSNRVKIELDFEEWINDGPEVNQTKNRGEVKGEKNFDLKGVSNGYL